MCIRDSSFIARRIFGPGGVAVAAAESATGARMVTAAAEAGVTASASRFLGRFPGGLLRTALFGVGGLALLLTSTSAFASEAEDATIGSSWFTGLVNSGFLDAGILAATLFGTVGVGGVTGILSNIARVGTAMVGLLANPAFLALTALTAVGGLLAIGLFGEGDSFNQRLAIATQNISEFFGFAEDRATQLQSIINSIDFANAVGGTGEFENLLGTREVINQVDVNRLDLDALSTQEFVVLREAIDRVASINQDIADNNDSFFGSQQAGNELLLEQNSAVNFTNSLLDRLREEQRVRGDNFLRALSEGAAGGDLNLLERITTLLGGAGTVEFDCGRQGQLDVDTANLIQRVTADILGLAEVRGGALTDEQREELAALEACLLYTSPSPRD